MAAEDHRGKPGLALPLLANFGLPKCQSELFSSVDCLVFALALLFAYVEPVEPHERLQALVLVSIALASL